MPAPKSLRHGLFTACAAIAVLQAGSTLAFAANATFYDAALCKPPYSLTSSTKIYEAAEKLAKPDTSSMGAAIYKIPQIGRDGFESDEVFFANGAVGVLIKGLRADELAAKYKLKREKPDLLGASSKGYARPLAKTLQPPAGLAGPGKVSIVARESDALPGKTLLACEFVAD
ncbi:hypothetical protein [Bosea sp. 685]|uniref:hypothetical protein n=1 Tax=Bosea sp. 685 TaxID=3080057 RepID=UPI0028931B3A|nr:hypothetical protein [Bosea sp. 685]WNJ89350.1 hypothetical protein RMR04_23490 [Bosea sp. 685]